MVLFNDNNDQLADEDIAAIKVGLKQLDGVPVLSTDDLNDQLEDYYADAVNFYQQNNPVNGPGVNQAAAFISFGGILDAIRKAICAVLPPAATVDEIVDAVLNAVGNILWGFFKFAIVHKLVKYLVDMGIGAFCPAPAAEPAVQG